MRPETKRKIGDFTYTVQHLNPDQAMDLANEYLAIIGPIMASVVAASAAGDTERSLTPEFAKALQQLTPDTLKRHRKLIEGATHYQRADGTGLQLAQDPEHFRGRLADHYELFVWGMQVQLGDFFGSALHRIKSLFPGFIAGSESSPNLPPSAFGGKSGG